MRDLMTCLEIQKRKLEEQGYSVAYIAIYGSQNYGLDINDEEYMSDIDMKAIIVPTLDDLVRNSNPISTVVDTEWGQCDLKDIRTFFQTLLKANPAYIETLYTKYYIVDEKFEKEFNHIFELKDSLVETLSAQFIRSMYGMMCEKEKALCHPYPSIAHKIEKWGFDGKQLSHQYRLWLMMLDYYKHGKPLNECFKPKESEIKLLLDLKTNSILNVEEAVKFSKEISAQAKEFRDSILENIDESKIDYSVKDAFISLSQDIIKNKIIKEVEKSVESK